MNSHSTGAGVMSNLKQKMQTLRDELDKYRDLYEDKCHELEREVARRTDSENEIQSFTRRIQIVEDERDQLDQRLHTALEKLNEASKVVDEHERSRRSLESRQNMDDDKISTLEEQLRISKAAQDIAERKFEEVARRLQITEAELERAEERAEAAESNARQLDTNLHTLTSSLKSLEISEHTLAQREENYEMTISDLNRRLREAEHAVEMLSRELKCKQSDLDRAEESLQQMQSEYKALRDEMDICYQDLNSL